MHSRKKKKTNTNRELKQKKIIRCKLFMKPVFESDFCSEFVADSNGENSNHCRNCGYSF